MVFEVEEATEAVEVDSEVVEVETEVEVVLLEEVEEDTIKVAL